MTTDASCDASISFQADTSAVTSIAGLDANKTYYRAKKKVENKRGKKERKRRWRIREGRKSEKEGGE